MKRGPKVKFIVPASETDGGLRTRKRGDGRAYYTTYVSEGCDTQKFKEFGRDAKLAIMKFELWRHGRIAEGIGALQQLEHLRVVKVNPGDLIVYSTPASLSLHRRDQIRRVIITEFPNNRVLIIESGSLGVFRNG